MLAETERHCSIGKALTASLFQTHIDRVRSHVLDRDASVFRGELDYTKIIRATMMSQPRMLFDQMPRFDDAVAQYKVTLATPDGNKTKSIQVVMRPSEAALESVVDSVHHDPGAFDMAAYVLASLIRDGVEISEQHRELAADIISGSISRPVVRGRKKVSKLRNMLIGNYVFEGVNAGLLGTRNDESEEKSSSCDAVAEALRQCSLTPNSYKGIKSIWLWWLEKTRKKQAMLIE